MKRVLLLLFFAATIFSCSNKTEKVVIVHVNDLHAKIDQFPKLAYFVDSLRNAEENVFLLCAGDLFSGNPYVDMYKEKGYPMIDIMNEIKFDVSVLGNHEFDYGQATLNKRISEAKFPFINSTIIPDESAVFKKLKDYITLTTKSGSKINIIGLGEKNENNTMSSHPKNLKGLTIAEPLEMALKVVDENKLQGVNILLTHCGIKGDTKIAEGTDKFPIIIGGHSHTKLKNGKKVNKSLIAQASSYLKYFGVISLELEKGKIKSKEAKLVKASTIKSKDSKIQEMVNTYNNNPELQKPIGVSSHDLTTDEQIGSLMCDAVADAHKLDIVFQNSGGIRSQFSKGDIRIADVYKNDPFGNYVHVYNMNLAQIKEFITKALNSGNGDAVLMTAGVKYKVTKSKDAKVKSIVIMDLKGKKLKNNRTYQVGMNSYISAAFSFDKSTFDREISFSTASMLVDYIRKIKDISSYSKMDRVEIMD